MSGLDAGHGVVLRNNGGDDITVDSDGTFTFAGRVTGAYEVTVARQPFWQDCAVTHGAGTAGDDVGTVRVTCANYPTFVRTVASLVNPIALAIDASGDVYVADYNEGLYRVTPGGSTVQLDTDDRLGLALGPDGAVYTTLSDHNQVSRLMPGGALEVFAGTGAPGADDGPRLSARFTNPSGLAFDAVGNLYVSEGSAGNRIRKITPAGLVSTFAGAGPAGSLDGPGAFAQFNMPWGMAVDDDGFVYVAEFGGHRIRRIAPDGTVTTHAGTGVPGADDGMAAAASFRYPVGVAIGPDGALYVADAGNNKLRRISAAGRVTTIAGTGVGVVGDGPAATATLNYPSDIAFDASGRLYFVDASGGTLRTLGR